MINSRKQKGSVRNPGPGLKKNPRKKNKKYATIFFKKLTWRWPAGLPGPARARAVGAGVVPPAGFKGDGGASDHDSAVRSVALRNLAAMFVNYVFQLEK